MSFMFNPSAYAEPTAINHIGEAQTQIKKYLAVGSIAIGQKIVSSVKDIAFPLICMDGYAAADFMPLTNICSGLLMGEKKPVQVLNIRDYFRSAEELEAIFAPSLPEDLEKDPVLLFGRRVEDAYSIILDAEKIQKLIDQLKHRQTAVILYGCGALYTEEIRKLADVSAYVDIIPKEAVLRAKSGRMSNLGDTAARPFKRMMRRAYYVDFEAALTLRRQLIRNGEIDFYVDGTDLNRYKMLPMAAFTELTRQITLRPFRSRPVYLEGVWGGQYVKHIRNIPDSAMKNLAWVFDFIPMEVSVAVDLDGEVFEMPFYTVLQSQEEAIMGKACTEKFGGYFPIRFNYDDTYHSSGNMSIQCHSGSEYNKANYNEFGRQDESYYIVDAGHGAKTYLGFNDDIDPQEFIAEAKRSEKDHQPVDYQHYIHAEESKPGLQVMIPAGTIHASGRNQVILEIGSLTIGSYTYKMYDYLRPDLDGKPRPIHTYHGERVLRTERNTAWIHNNVVQSPRVIRSGEGWKESIIGQHDLLYFSLRHLEFEKEIEDNTNGIFHVLSVVNGEDILIQSLDHPEYSYRAKYLDIVLVPANVGRYFVKNLTNAPVILHKTCLKDGFEQDHL